MINSASHRPELQPFENLLFGLDKVTKEENEMQAQI
jgi:hypothetical protein